MSILELRDVHRVHGSGETAVAALRGVSLTVEEGELVAVMGSLLGAAAGLGGSVAVLLALNRGHADVWPAPTPYPIALPWRNVAVALLVVPAVAMLGAGLLTRSRLPVERRL